MTLQPVHELFRVQAIRLPDAVAISRKGVEVSYAEVETAANHLAARLCERKLVRETPVAVCLERSADSVAASLAIWKVGATVLLLDPAWPPRTIQEVLARSGARILIARRAPQSVTTDVVLQVTWNPVASDESGRFGSVRACADNLAYLATTCVANGLSRLVGVTHGAVAHRAHNVAEFYRVSGRDRAAWLSPPGSAYAITELWPFLSSGASVHVAENVAVAVPGDLRDWINATRITACFVFPPLGNLLLRQPWPADTPLRSMTVVRDSTRGWDDFGVPFKVTFEYGATEANGVSRAVMVSGRGRPATGTGEDSHTNHPISRAWPDVELFIVDEHVRPVEPGQLGELCVAGPELARGYYGDSKTTAEKFVPAPAGSGARMYRTGDLVRMRPDGQLEHRGPVEIAWTADKETSQSGRESVVLALQAEVLQIWCEKLGLDSAEPRDNFLDAGGNSLLASLIVNAVYERFGVCIRLRDFFREPTPAALAETVYDSLDDKSAWVRGSV